MPNKAAVAPNPSSTGMGPLHRPRRWHSSHPSGFWRQRAAASALSRARVPGGVARDANQVGGQRLQPPPHRD